MSRDVVRRWPQARLRVVAAQVATFLKELHPLIEEGRAATAPEVRPRGFAAHLSAEVDKLLAPRASGAAIKRARQELADLGALPDSPIAVCHTDLGGNIVVDDLTDSVGVIDFGSCFITHPALDVASLSVLGDDFVDACAADYPLLATVAAEAAAVRRTFALQDALYGARQEEWSYVDGILREYA